MAPKKKQNDLDKAQQLEKIDDIAGPIKHYKSFLRSEERPVGKAVPPLCHSLGSPYS